MNKEIILPIESYPGYFATSMGRILSTKKHGPPTIKEGIYHEKRTFLSIWGYLLVHLVSPMGRKKTYSVHSLICTTFNGPSLGRVVNHKDGIRLHNESSNLEWTTRSGNERHKYDYLKVKGPRLGKGKLTVEQQKELYDRYQQGELKLYHAYGISNRQYHRILKRFINTEI
jgi:hypothetical protein